MRDQLLEVIEAVAPRFDRILLDTGAGISDVVLYAVSLADEVLVVATPEPTSLTDAYATIKVLATQQQRTRIRLVVNQARHAGEGRAIRGQLQQVVDRYVTQRRPTCRSSSSCSARCRPTPRCARRCRSASCCSTRYPGASAAQAIVAIAARLAEA